MGIKFIHAADLHLDSTLHTIEVQDEDTKNRIERATRTAFDNLVEKAIEEEVDFVLVVGDILDISAKDYSTFQYLARKVNMLSQAGIDVYATLGNHDAGKYAVDLFKKISGLHVIGFNKPRTIVKENAGVAIHGYSFVKRWVSENVVVNYPEARKDLFNIGMLHTSLTGRAGHDVYAPCSVDDLKRMGYQYWALGHVHGYEQVNDEPAVVFPGCIQGRHINETGPKGCVLVTVDNNQLNIDFIELDDVRWEVVHVDGSKGMTALFDSIEQRLYELQQELDIRVGIIRVMIDNLGFAIDDMMELTEQIRLRASGIGMGSLIIHDVVINSFKGQGDIESKAELIKYMIDAAQQDDVIEDFYKKIEALKSKLPADIAREVLTEKEILRTFELAKYSVLNHLKEGYHNED